MRLALFLTAALVLAGCAATTDEPPAANETNETVTFAEDYALGNATIPAEQLQNASLGGEHDHDAWGDAEQLVLLDAEAVAGPCEGAQDSLFYALVTAPEGGAYGCVRALFPEGTLVPEGTGQLVVEIDAKDALKSGAIRLQYRNKAREEIGNSTSEPQHAWTIDLTSADWDIPHAPATTWVVYVGAEGPAGVFDGPVRLRVLANRIPGWEPIVAIAHVDHWKLPELHDLPAPGVMRILEGQGNVTNIDPARFVGQADVRDDDVPLTDIIAPGSKYLTIVADTTSSDCNAALRCWYVPFLRVGGYERDLFGELLYEEGGRRVYAWSVPDQAPEDSVYAEASTSVIQGRIDACAAGSAGGSPECGFVSFGSTSAQARLLALTWKGDIDLDVLSAIAGAAPP